MTVPATEKDNSPLAQFREKVAERIRADIGDLMPDEMLQEIVKQSIEAELNRPIGGEYSKTPWLQTEVRKHIGDKVHAEARRQIEEKEKEIGAMLADEIRKQLPEMMATIFLTLIKGQAWQMESALANFAQKMRNGY